MPHVDIRTYHRAPREYELEYVEVVSGVFLVSQAFEEFTIVLVLYLRIWIEVSSCFLHVSQPNVVGAVDDAAVSIPRISMPKVLHNSVLLLLTNISMDT